MKYTAVSVRQLTKRKYKPWQARAKYKDPQGKWKELSKMLPEATGKKEAQRLANEWLDELNAQADLMPNIAKTYTLDETYNDYLNHQLATGEIEKSTYSNSIASYKKYIKPYLGDYIFSSVDKTVLSGWLTKLYQLGLSQNTIHTTYARLKKVYNYYFNNGELLQDPFKGVKMPKKGDAKTTHLTNEQMDNVLEAVYCDFEPQDPMYVGILLAFYAGLRRGEICGLRWNDIDFYKHTITVRSAVGVSNGDRLGDYTKNPKNKSSNRSFPMLPQLEEALKQRKILIAPEDNWFVIGEEEQFMRPQQYNRLFSEFVERHSLVDAYGKKIVPHGLRHNFATVGIRAGMDIASLALMMGHASRAMTLDTYGDANADALNLASVKLKESFNENTSFFEYEEEEEQADPTGVQSRSYPLGNSGTVEEHRRKEKPPEAAEMAQKGLFRMDLNKYKDHHIEYLEADPLPAVCENCEEDCGSCDNAGLRWYLSEKDDLIIQRKAKAKSIERCLRDIERIDRRLAELEEQ